MPKKRGRLMKFSILSLGRENGLRGISGQILVEYGLVLLLIAIVVIMMVMGVGKSTNNMYSKINSSITSAMQ